MAHALKQAMSVGTPGMAVARPSRSARAASSRAVVDAITARRDQDGSASPLRTRRQESAHSARKSSAQARSQGSAEAEAVGRGEGTRRGREPNARAFPGPDAQGPA